MFKLNFLHLSVLVLIFGTACNSSAPSVEILHIDSSDRVHNEQELVNDEPPQAPVNLPPYDGTIETARKQVNEILDAIEKQRITLYTYNYDNKSGEDPMKGRMCFSYNDPTGAKDREWYLDLYNTHYSIEYFFNNDQKLFAIRQWQRGDKAKLSAEIFYKPDESLIEGSWLKRANDDTTFLANYKGDYWYDFLEGYPLYRTTQQMKDDKSLMYEQ